MSAPERAQEEPGPDLVEQIAFECLERFARDGDAAIGEACRAHPELTDAVRRVLLSLAEAGLLDSAPGASPGEPPRVLGEYRLLRKLGRGGMGDVWLAEQVPLGRRVAVKILAAGAFATPRARQRFQREIAALSQLDHPGICTIHAAGEAEGVPYLAMRYVEGETLADELERLRRAPAPERRSARRVPETLLRIEKVALALHHAHEQGLVHRDVKPANIMVDNDGEPVILDFGLARALEDCEGMTATGDLLGTPSYMAPEQIQTGLGPVDRRTDVYGLAVTLYECLTLHCPFTGQGRDSLYRSILTDATPDPRHSNPDIPREVADILAKAMEKAPARRFATMQDFADELRRIRLHEPIRTRRPGPLRRTWRWTQRNPLAAGILALLALGLSGSLAALAALQRAESRSQTLLRVAETDRIARESPRQAFAELREATHRLTTPLTLERLQESMGGLHEWINLGDHGGHVGTALWSPRGDRIVTVCEGGRGARLFSSAGRLVRVLATTGEPRATSVAFSHDGTLLALGSWGGAVELFATDTGERQAPLDPGAVRRGGELSDAVGIAWSEDDAFLATSWTSGRVCLWTRAGSFVREFRRPDGGPAHGRCARLPLAFAGSSKLVSAGARAGGSGRERPQAIRIWDVDGTLHADWVGHTDLVRALAVHGDRIVSASDDGFARLWTLEGGSHLPQEFVHDHVYAAAFAPDGKHIAMATANGVVRVTDRDGRLVREWQVPTTIPSLRFRPDGAAFATAGWNQHVQVWDPRGQELLGLRGHLNAVTSVDFAPDGRSLVSSSWDGTARIWSVEPLGARVRGGHQDGVSALAISPDGSVLVSIAAGGEVCAWNAEGHLLRKARFPGAARGRWCATFRPDSRSLVFVDERSRVYSWHPSSDQEPSALPWRRNASCAVFLPDGRTLAIAAGPNVFLWDGESAERPLDAKLGPRLAEREILALALAPDGTQLLIGDKDHGASLWTLAGRQELALEGHRGAVVCAAFSPDGNRILTGSEDRTAILWDRRTGRRLLTYAGHRGGVRWVGFSPDGSRVLTGSHDTTLRLYATGSEECLLVLRGHRGSVNHACFLPGGRQVVSASTDGTLRWWWLEAKDILAAADAIHAGTQAGAAPATAPAQRRSR